MSTTETAGEPVGESGIGRWTGWACDAAGLLLVALTVLIGVEIVVRGLAGKSTLISDEYSGYLFVWITMIGFAHALQSGAFLRVDNVVNRMGPRGQALADILSATTGALVSAACVYATGTLMMASWRFGTVSIQPSATPLWIPQLMLPVGYVVLVCLYLALFRRALRRLVAQAG